jgi:hypothetical protein
MKSLAAQNEPGVPRPNHKNYYDPRNDEWVDLPDLHRKEKLKSKENKNYN